MLSRINRLAALLLGIAVAGNCAPIDWWNQQRIGANCFNEVPRAEWFEAASEAGIGLVRLTYDKWTGERRDFLLGDAGDYQGLVQSDLAELRRVLDIAEANGIKIVLAPLSLPGSRNRQRNGMKRDPRLWTEEEYLQQAANFWRDLAKSLAGHPAIAAYNLLNEPHPEWFHGKQSFWDGGFDEWYESVKGTPGDLNRFNRTLTAAIRSADKQTPIIVESGLYATPWAFEYLEPLDDPAVIYSFHMYEPYDYTTRRINKGRFSYPDRLPDQMPPLDEFFNPVRQWAERHNIPPERIFAAEFGCDRQAAGAERYLADLVKLFNREGWHWAFYAYREDVWQGMDYELGAGPPGAAYWKHSEAGTLHEHYGEVYGSRPANLLWSILRAEFDSRR